MVINCTKLGDPDFGKFGISTNYETFEFQFNVTIILYDANKTFEQILNGSKH